MRPISVVTLIILGSCFAIMVSLGDEYPRLQAEFKPLLSSLTVFVGMTAISATSFYTLLKNHRFWYLGQAAMWLGLVSTGWYYWP